MSPSDLATRPTVDFGGFAGLSHDPDRRPRVLVTGAGGPAAIGFLRLASRPDVEMYAADIDPVASGLYLVPSERRILVPRGDDPEFAERMREICRRLEITVLVPTVDSELLPLAGVRHLLAAGGTTLLAAPSSTLAVCLDKAELARVCADSCDVPGTGVLHAETPVSYPSIVKPRTGSGSRGIRLVEGPGDLVGLPRDGSQLAQEYLPGEELSVDVFVRADGTVVAAVPRLRDRVDSGVAVAGRTIHDQPCIEQAVAVCRAIGLRGVANVQLRRRADGSPALLEVNPRLPGSLVLSAAAGANLAALALAEALGESVPAFIPFREVAMVRYLADVVVEVEEYARAGLTEVLMTAAPR
ncbi:MAG: ATP-grasp domain-containing protein [Ornithinimicrobium sp.]